MVVWSIGHRAPTTIASLHHMVLARTGSFCCNMSWDGDGAGWDVSQLLVTCCVLWCCLQAACWVVCDKVSEVAECMVHWYCAHVMEYDMFVATILRYGCSGESAVHWQHKCVVTELGLRCRGFTTLFRVQGEQHILASSSRSSKQAGGSKVFFAHSMAQKRHPSSSKRPQSKCASFVTSFVQFQAV